jgi:glycine/D-amino acid oxidase-like deaminating enzyme
MKQTSERMPRGKAFDVVIAGAGIIGLSIAWELARRCDLKIAVLEKGSATGEGSTGASSAICRCRYSMDEMLRLASDGVNAYRNWPAYTGLSRPHAVFQNDGILWMTGSNTRWADVEHARLQRFGISSAVLDDHDLQERFPALSTCTIAPDTETGEPHECRGGGRHLFELDGGYMDPTGAMQDLVDACRAKGVEVSFRAEVTAIRKQGGRVSGVELGNGVSIATPLLINAAGPWCHRLYEAAGLELQWDLRPTRIQVLYRDRPPELPGHIPVTVDMEAGIYFRTQNRGQQLIISSVLEEDERETVSNPDEFDRDADEDFRLVKLHVLHHRLPLLPQRGKVMGYCGLYTTNRDDVHPIVGPTDVDGFWVANGFSGHGFKLAPAIGSMVAREITGTSMASDTSIPISFFAVDREPIQLESKSVLA